MAESHDSLDSDAQELNIRWVSDNFSEMVVGHIREALGSRPYPMEADFTYIDRDQGYVVELSDDTTGNIWNFGRAALRDAIMPGFHARPGSLLGGRTISAMVIRLEDYEAGAIEEDREIDAVRLSNGNAYGILRGTRLKGKVHGSEVGMQFLISGWGEELTGDELIEPSLVVKNLKNPDRVVDTFTQRTQAEVMRDKEVAKRLDRLVDRVLAKHGETPVRGWRQVIVDPWEAGGKHYIEVHRDRGLRPSNTVRRISIAEIVGEDNDLLLVTTLKHFPGVKKGVLEKRVGHIPHTSELRADILQIGVDSMAQAMDGNTHRRYLEFTEDGGVKSVQGELRPEGPGSYDYNRRPYVEAFVTQQAQVTAADMSELERIVTQVLPVYT